jgi:hypothetical protein
LKKKFKISLIIDKNFYNKHSNIKIISQILSLQYVIIDSLFVIDYKTTNHKKNFFIVSLLKKIISFAENKFLFEKNKILNNKFKKKISLIKKCNLKIEKKNDTSPIFFINKAQSKTIKNQKLKILINLTDIIILSKINNITLEGIISSMKEKNDVSFLFPGFDSAYKNIKFSKIFIYLFKSNSKIINIIDKGYYNSKRYWFFNFMFLKEKSNIILFKNLKLILLNSKIKTLKKINTNKINYQYLKFSDLFLYILERYIFYLFKKNKVENWSIKLSNAKFNFNLNLNLNNLSFVAPMGSFWADPFLFTNKNKNYVFFENFNYTEKKGKISYFRLDKPKEIIDIIKKDYHLSYPFIFYFKKEIYMIPETSKKMRIEIWKSKNFPKKWFLFKKVFVGEDIADATILNYKGQLWLFANKSDDKFNDHDSELYIYKIKNNNFNHFIPHKLNPVICDSKSARNAGNFFKIKNRYFRPSQININQVYGYGLNINEIRQLNLNNYKEIIKKKFISKNESIHHMSVLNDKFIFDKKSKAE